MRVKIPVDVKPTRPEDKAVSQEVAFTLDGQPLNTETVGPEGGKVYSAGFDLADDGSATLIVTVTPVDAAGNKTTTPATATKTFTGKDTTAPSTPESPEIGEPEEETPA